MGDTLVKFAEDYNSKNSQKIDFFIFGHQHIILDKKLPDGAKILILGDWINKFSYAVWDGTDIKIVTFLRQ